MASPYINNALDGKDRGANIATINYYNGFVNSGDRRLLSIPRPTGNFTYLGVARAAYPRTYMSYDYFPVYTRLVNVNSNATLINAFANAQPGDRIVVDPAITYTARIVAPVINGDPIPGGNGVVTVISKAIHDSMPGGSGLATVLPQKVRVDPGDVANLIRWKNTSTANEPTLEFAGPTMGWRIVGFWFDVDPFTFSLQRIIKIGNGDTAVQTNASLCPSNVTVERCFFKSHPSAQIRHVVEGHGKYVTLADSYFDDELHDIADAQCFYFANGPGPTAQINNRYNEMTMAFIYGGAPTVCGAPSDNEIKLNKCTRPLKWNPNHPSYDGSNWQIKCGVEIKKALYTDIAYNEIENNWPAAQDGFAALIKDETYGATDAAQGRTQDVLLRHNWIRNAPSGINAAGVSGTPVKRVLSYGNLGSNMAGQYFAFSSSKFFGTGISEDYTIIHDTWLPGGTVNAIVMTDAIMTRFTMLDCIIGPTSYGIKGAGQSSGTNTLNAYAPNYDVRKNVFVGVNIAGYPANNDGPASIVDVQFIDYVGGNYALLGTTQTAGGETGGESPVIGSIAASLPKLTASLPTGTAEGVGAIAALFGPIGANINTTGPDYFEGSIAASLAAPSVILIGEVDPVIGAITAQALPPSAALTGTQVIPPVVIPDPEEPTSVTSIADETPAIPVVTEDSIITVT